MLNRKQARGHFICTTLLLWPTHYQLVGIMVNYVYYRLCLVGRRGPLSFMTWHLAHDYVTSDDASWPHNDQSTQTHSQCLSIHVLAAIQSIPLLRDGISTVLSLGIENAQNAQNTKRDSRCQRKIPCPSASSWGCSSKTRQIIVPLTIICRTGQCS